MEQNGLGSRSASTTYCLPVTLSSPVKMGMMLIVAPHWSVVRMQRVNIQRAFTTVSRMPKALDTRK